MLAPRLVVVSCPCGEQFAGVEEVLFSVRGLQDQFTLRVESYGDAGLDFSFLRDGHGFAEYVGVLGPFAHKVIHFPL